MVAATFMAANFLIDLTYYTLSADYSCVKKLLLLYKEKFRLPYQEKKPISSRIVSRGEYYIFYSLH